MKTPGLAERRRGFQIHAFSFVIGIVVLAIINYTTSPQYWWVLWVILGWGIGLLSHYWFGVGPGTASEEDVPDKQG